MSIPDVAFNKSGSLGFLPLGMLLLGVPSGKPSAVLGEALATRSSSPAGLLGGAITLDSRPQRLCLQQERPSQCRVS